jgi:hypothetical protein
MSARLTSSSSRPIWMASKTRNVAIHHKERAGDESHAGDQTSQGGLDTGTVCRCAGPRRGGVLQPRLRGFFLRTGTCAPLSPILQRGPAGDVKVHRREQATAPEDWAREGSHRQEFCPHVMQRATKSAEVILTKPALAPYCGGRKSEAPQAVGHADEQRCNKRAADRSGMSRNGSCRH